MIISGTVLWFILALIVAAVVQYRGAPWIACAEEGDLTPGTWIIARVDGTRLVLRSAALK